MADFAVAYMGHNRKIPVHVFIPAKTWWGMLDLNQRLLPCEDSTLPLS